MLQPRPTLTTHRHSLSLLHVDSQDAAGIVRIVTVINPQENQVYYWSLNTEAPWLRENPACPHNCDGPYGTIEDAMEEALELFPGYAFEKVEPVHHSLEKAGTWTTEGLRLVVTFLAPLDEFTERLLGKITPPPEERFFRESLTCDLKNAVTKDWEVALQPDTLRFVSGRQENGSVRFCYSLGVSFYGYEFIDRQQVKEALQLNVTNKDTGEAWPAGFIALLGKEESSV